MTGLAPGHVTIRLRGSAGQSLGAWAVQGLKLQVFGDANDYVGKGLSGGSIVVHPMTSSPLESNENTIIGNTVLYGATAGELFAAVAVVEGCGSNGCEYMTGGTVVILGKVGYNFAAGMTGGMAFIYDPENVLPVRINPDSVICQRIQVQHYEEVLKDLVQRHAKETLSRFAERLLLDWDREVKRFWQIVPREMLGRLEVPVSEEDAKQA